MSNQLAIALQPLQIGQTFESWEQLQNSIIDNGVLQERVIVTVYKDNGRFMARCRMNTPQPNGCGWFIRAIRSLKSELITIRGLCNIHTCASADHYKRRMHTKSRRLADHVFDIVRQNTTTRACFLRDTLKAQVHPDVQYHNAHAALERCKVKLNGKDKDTFYLIPAHLQHILDHDPGATARWRAPDGHFSNLFVCPSASRDAFAHCRPLVALDGAPTRSGFPQMLLLATTLDANNTVLLLAYGMAPSENGTEWLWFLELLAEAIPKLKEEGTVFISDREKGLMSIVEDIYAGGYHYFCCWHIGLNLRQNGFSKNVVKMFLGLVYAVTPEEYERRFQRLNEVNPRAAEYIRATADPAHYSRAYIPARRWGKESSQQAEIENRVLKPERSVPAFQSSCMLWDYMMRTYYEKKVLSESTDTPFPPNIMAELKDIELRAYKLKCVPSSHTEVQITDEQGRQFRVQLSPEWTCSCGDFQDKLIPCVHAWRGISYLKKTHYNYVHHKYSTATFKQTYSNSLPALIKDGLVPNPHCGPPLKVRKRGRPTEKARLRFEEESGLRKIRRCKVCASSGHDKRNCPSWKDRRMGVDAEHSERAEARPEPVEQNLQPDPGADISGSEDYYEPEDVFENLSEPQDGVADNIENEDPNLWLESQVSMAASSQASIAVETSQMSYSQLLAAVTRPVGCPRKFYR